MVQPVTPQGKVTFTSEVNPIANAPSPRLVKKLDLTKKQLSKKPLILGLVILLVGIGSGFGLNLITGGSAIGIKSAEEVSQSGVKVGDVVGSNESSFKDKATGVLASGGIDGEGSHRLLREGGPDQTVYLTSSIVDLDLFVGHKVEVWGETFSAQKAGWLMDIGRVKVLELDAQAPFEEE